MLQEQAVESNQRVENMESLKEKKKSNSCKAVMDIRQIEVFTTIKLPADRKKRIEVI